MCDDDFVELKLCRLLPRLGERLGEEIPDIIERVAFFAIRIADSRHRFIRCGIDVVEF